MRDLDAANFFAGNGPPILLGDNRNPTNAITVITSNGYSRYRALTTKIDKRKLIDVKPQHDSFGLKDAKLIAPGRPESSVLLHRIGCRGPGQMPPLATSLVDEPALTMLREWVRQIEVRAFEKLQKSMRAAAEERNLVEA